MASDTSTPRGFYTHGKEFFAAAEAVFSAPKAPILPLAFLWGRTIELLLKSYLLTVGVSAIELRSRRFSHNLVALFEEARKRGIDDLLGGDPIDRGLIQLLNVEYGSKRLEYRHEWASYLLPDPVVTRRLIRKLLARINHRLGQHVGSV